ncbi:MAG TPA: hypothetical protein VG265_07325 [Gaiellaceae bacterium]|nr:hypothetical protein [Gaiellaceae bacterium]
MTRRQLLRRGVGALAALALPAPAAARFFPADAVPALSPAQANAEEWLVRYSGGGFIPESWQREILLQSLRPHVLRDLVVVRAPQKRELAPFSELL